MPAAELRLHVVRVLVLEKVPVPASSFVRVVSLHIRRLELMVMRGLLDRLLERGRQRPVGGLVAAIPKPFRTAWIPRTPSCWASRSPSSTGCSATTRPTPTGRSPGSASTSRSRTST
jgi:2-polyprenyl-6-methoxyphenol hydroxylase-like FAD-dependent oxidoreductase